MANASAGAWYDSLIVPLSRRLYGLGKLVLLGGALSATFLLFAGIAMRVALRTREVQVPHVVGQALGEAERALVEVGLAIKVDEVRRIDPSVAAGRVVRQDPVAGVSARQQRTVRVWLSAGPRVTTVSDLVGQSERAARLRLEQDGVTLSTVSTLRSADYANGVVIAQDPPSASASSRAALLVNRGNESAAYVMPDVRALEGRRVAEALRELGLRVAIVPARGATSGPVGAVVSQTPPPGSRVSPADAITLEVSR